MTDRRSIPGERVAEETAEETAPVETAAAARVMRVRRQAAR